MAKGINRLPASYAKLKPGLHNDGNCLYLQVTVGPHGNRRRSWIFRYTLAGRRSRDMGLGGTAYISLADARELASKYRKLAKQGIDPINHRDAEVAKNLAASATVMTFDEAAAAYVQQHRAGWTNPIYAKQWPSSLKRYASPVIGKMSVADIDTAHVMKILSPIWTRKTVTAQRVRSRIESVLGWAKTAGYRTAENCARWDEHLQNMLAKPSKVHNVKPMAALSYEEMPTLLAELRQQDSMAALALEFLALTAVRIHDVLNARWTDIDLSKKIWVIPVFSKSNKEHRVPLSSAAITVIEKSPPLFTRNRRCPVGRSEYVVATKNSGKRLSKNIPKLFERIGRKSQTTAHGFREPPHVGNGKIKLPL